MAAPDAWRDNLTILHGFGRAAPIHRGVTLIEIMIALAILVFGVLAIIGMFHIGGKSHSHAMDADLASEMLNELRSEINLYASRGEKAPADWERDPQKYHDSERLMYRVKMRPVGGNDAEKRAAENHTPLLYVVRIDLFSPETEETGGDTYETTVLVRYDLQ